jgi:hypothetical protein
METIRLSSEDLEKVQALLPFTLDYVDEYTPKALRELPGGLEASFLIRPMTTKDRKRWQVCVLKVEAVDRMNRVAMAKAIEDKSGEYPEAKAEKAEAELLEILTACVQKVNYYEVSKDGIKPFEGTLGDLPEWLIEDLSKRLMEISSISSLESRGFGS